MFIHLDTLVRLSSTRNPDSIGTPVSVPHPPAYTKAPRGLSIGVSLDHAKTAMWAWEPAKCVSTFGSPFPGPKPPMNGVDWRTGDALNFTIDPSADSSHHASI